MNMRKLTGAVVIGLALPVMFVASASADIREDIQTGVGERVDAELSDIDQNLDGCSLCGDDDGDDGATFDVVGYEDFSGIDDEVRESVSGIGDEVRDDVLEGSDG